MIAKASPNIAFLKYWGKLETRNDDDLNIPTNPSLSLTLSKAETSTSVTAQKSTSTRTEFFLNGAPASSKDVAKVEAHLDRVLRFLGEAPRTFKVESRNNFPAGAGIASSASAFAALTLAALGEIQGEAEAKKYLTEKNADFSALARRGSGSACRSVGGPFMKWVDRSAVLIKSDWRLRDTIIILSHKHKAVPSSDGHKLAQSSPFFSARLKRVPGRLQKIEAAIARKSLKALGPVLEEEALELHEIARTGTPSVDYLLPETKKIIECLATLRQRDFYFTLDAGPNVHLISEQSLKNDIEVILAGLGIQAEIWEDETGFGPALGR